MRLRSTRIRTLAREPGPILGSSMPDDNGSGYEDFFSSEYGLVVAFLCKAGFDYQVADDSTQEAMLSAYRTWSTITNPRGWIRTVAHRVAIRKAALLRDELSLLVARGYGPTAGDGTEWYRHFELHDELLRALALLPDRQRLVMVWHLDGFLDEEISRATGIKVSTVRSNLRFAREKLRKNLASPHGEKTAR
jgi:RNA polymerase sigma factor (sigma-70 family)